MNWTCWRRAQLGDTPLHIVAGSKARAFSEQHLEDYAKCVTVLCDAGALLEAQDNVRGSGRCEQMGWIAAPNDVQHVTLRLQLGQTPLHVAAHDGNFPCVRALVAAGANLADTDKVRCQLFPCWHLQP